MGDPQHPTDDELDAFAADPSKWGKPKRVLNGAAAAAHGRATLEAAGVDVDELERRFLANEKIQAEIAHAEAHPEQREARRRRRVTE